jgi:hypothetical protein
MDWILFIKDSDGDEVFVTRFDGFYAAKDAADNLNAAGIEAWVEEY